MGSQRVGHDWATELNWTVSRCRGKAAPWNGPERTEEWTMQLASDGILWYFMLSLVSIMVCARSYPADPVGGMEPWSSEQRSDQEILLCLYETICMWSWHCMSRSPRKTVNSKRRELWPKPREQGQSQSEGWHREAGLASEAERKQPTGPKGNQMEFCACRAQTKACFKTLGAVPGADAAVK